METIFAYDGYHFTKSGFQSTSISLPLLLK